MLFPCIFPSLAHNKVDLVVEKADGSERIDTKNQEPGPVVVPEDILVGHSQLCHLHKHFLIFVNNLALEEFWNIEKY